MRADRATERKDDHKTARHNRRGRLNELRMGFPLRFARARKCAGGQRKERVRVSVRARVSSLMS